MAAHQRDSAAGPRRGLSAPAKSPTPPSPITGAALGLQARAGNRAVSGLLGSAPVDLQRLIATRPGELDRFIDTSDTLRKAFGGKLDGSKGAFMSIRRALSDYRSAADKGRSSLETQAQQLAALDMLCTRFLSEHADDQKRRTVVNRLHDEVASERASVSTRQAQARYQGNVESSRRPATAGESDPAKKFGFQALSSFGKMGAENHALEIAEPGHTGPKRDERIKKMKSRYGLTEAEISAITIFSAGDFSYINPATANNSSWLADQKKGSSDDWTRQDDRTLREEGSLHTGVAMQGLEKMEPYRGQTFRGARFSPQEFKNRFYMGKAMSFSSLASSSKDRDIALNFVFGLGAGATSDAAKSVGVLTVITDSGGRDISDIALVQKEAEVLILPGSVFTVVGIEEVDGHSEYADKVAEATKANKPLPKQWYVVKVEPSKLKPHQVRDTRWQGAKPGRAADPFAVPNQVGILGQNHRPA